ncbi:MAG: DNA replication and repair protein RecF [Cyclobacteriaceae bacterium]|nr:DNA replication and repair protein RecF [Cyclobacteriaceae bacterium]
MIFKNLSLFNFKNFETLDIGFEKGLNCFTGHNGAGKTNILDALHYLSITKSSINAVDSANIKFDEELFIIKSAVEINKKKHVVSCSVQLGKKKEVRVDKKEHEKLSEHIGLFPLVMISPNDSDLIYDSNEIRRRFFDSAMSQSNKAYLRHLIAYNFALKNRNALLKQFSDSGRLDSDLLQTYTSQLIEHGTPIYEERANYLNQFLDFFEQHYASLQSQNESVSITYESQLSEGSLKDRYNQSLQRDKVLQRTNVGIHKDGFLFTIFDKPLKRHGSQGQQKSFLIALKLAQYDLLASQKNLKPALLLDDVFDKLDDERMQMLLKKVTHETYGQLFITDARPERTMALLEHNQLKARIFEIEKGKVQNTTDYEPTQK